MCLQNHFLFLSSCVCGFMVWVWELSPRAECDLSGHLPPWPSCLFLAFSVSLLRSQRDLRWCQTDFSVEGHCDSSLYLTGLCHVRSMTVVVFVWNLIRDFASAIWRLCSFCSFYCFWLRVASGAGNRFCNIANICPEGLFSFLKPHFFFLLWASDRDEAAVLSGRVQLSILLHV